MNRKLLVLLLGMLLPFSVVAKNEVNPADLVIKANEIYQRAKAACKSGDYDKALKEYEEAISAFGDAAKAYRKAKAKKDEDNIKERIKSVKEERDECKKKQKEAKKAAREKEKQARETEKKAKDTEKIPGDADQAAKEAAKRTAPGTAPGTDPNASIIVGPRELVGKPSLAEKAATGAMGGLVGSVLDAPSRTAEKPRTYRDPSRKLDYNNLAAGNFDTETRARGLWTKDGLLISSRIEESPGKGTFQTLFLESCDGRRLYPQRYEIYDLWNESSVSVSWSKTSTSNGQVISQESGGWDDSWSKEFSSIKPVAGEATTIPGTWQQLGFDRAQSGARQIGAYFKLTPQQLAGMGELGLFVHTTRPAQDPVTTVPAHWLLSPGNEKQPLLSAVIRPSGPATESVPWQAASTACQQQQGLLPAAAGQPDPGSEPFPGIMPPPPRRSPESVAGTAIFATAGFPLPTQLTYIAKGTGQTTGHIADLTVTNEGKAEAEVPAMRFYIPSGSGYQPYVAKPLPATPIAAGSSQTVPIYGYCADVRRPPVPAGEDLPPPSNWIVVKGPVDHIQIPPRTDAAAPGRALVPGTDRPLPRAISQDDEPLLAAPLLLAAIAAIERKTEELQASGDLQTPFSANPEREREAVVQQTIWIYAAELEGEPYSKEEFTERLEQQYQDHGGISITAATPEEQQRLQQGADDFWDSFELVGTQAKVINVRDAS